MKTKNTPMKELSADLVKLGSHKSHVILVHIKHKLSVSEPLNFLPLFKIYMYLKRGGAVASWLTYFF